MVHELKTNWLPQQLTVTTTTQTYSQDHNFGRLYPNSHFFFASPRNQYFHNSGTLTIQTKGKMVENGYNKGYTY